MPRSGTVFFFNLISELFQFEKLEPKFTGGFRPTPPEWDAYKFDKTYLELRKNQVICAHYHMNTDFKVMLEDEDLLCFYLYRDPRDVAVSAALYIKYVLEHHALHNTFKLMSDSDAIITLLAGAYIHKSMLCYPVAEGSPDYIDFEGAGYFCKNAYPWLLHPKVIKLKYEYLFADNLEEQLSRVMEFNSIPVNRLLLKNVVTTMDFRNISGGRNRGEENAISHYRKGIAGDYKNYFTEAHKAIAKRYIGNHLINLGYETDFSW